ncbi:uracil-xanthine permease family protein [Amphibacillus sp. Q70]|uniref:uracil-xanthine permease family protein n=1 Tax=Amphibacillus sp. Q70 TaxID=3453416 RepID=UPI003F861056
MEKNQKSELEIIYGIDDRPKLVKAIPLAFQHVLAVFAANITVPLLVSGLLGLSSSETTFLIQCALLMAGITTFIQLAKYKGIGSGLPIVMGTSNAFIATVLLIAEDYGIPGVLGASLIGALFEILIGKNLKRLKRVFPPLVSGIVVLTIGITLIPVGIEQAAGGGENLGDLTSLLIATIVLVTIIVFNQSKNKFLKSSSILIGIIFGYIIAAFFNLVDFAPVLEANWLSFPKPFQYKLAFKPVAILTMLFMYLATTIETMGDVSAITNGAEGREPSDEELSGGVVADGISSVLAAFYNSFPNTSFTQNVGVVNLTGVFSKYVVRIGAVILIILALLPKFSSMIAIMPEPVLGGAALAMFSMVAVSGLSLLKKVKFDSRNMLIISISLGLGVGLNIIPEATHLLPDSIHFALTSGVVPAALVAIIMNLVLPKND